MAGWLASRVWRVVSSVCPYVCPQLKAGPRTDASTSLTTLLIITINQLTTAHHCFRQAVKPQSLASSLIVVSCNKEPLTLPGHTNTWYSVQYRHTLMSSCLDNCMTTHTSTNTCKHSYVLLNISTDMPQHSSGIDYENQHTTRPHDTTRELTWHDMTCNMTTGHSHMTRHENWHDTTWRVTWPQDTVTWHDHVT